MQDVWKYRSTIHGVQFVMTYLILMQLELFVLWLDLVGKCEPPDKWKIFFFFRSKFVDLKNYFYKLNFILFFNVGICFDIKTVLRGHL
jgi:hypothetical protein